MQDERITAVRRWADDHYTQGGDVIVEAFTDDELLELIAPAATPDEAIRIAADFCGLRREVENDVRGYGGLPPLATLD